MDELEFVRRISCRDKNAWSQFVDRYSRLIYSYIFRTSRSIGVVFTPEDAQDLCHEIFLLLAENDFAKLKTFQARNGCRLATWLRQVTVNYVISYLRKSKPLLSLDEENSTGSSLHEFLQSNLKSARQNLVDDELFLELKDCMLKLNPDELRLMELAYYQQATSRELELIFRLKRSALDMRKSRATAKLRDCMQGKGFMLDL